MWDVGIKDEGSKVFSLDTTPIQPQVLKVGQSRHEVHETMCQ